MPRSAHWCFAVLLWLSLGLVGLTACEDGGGNNPSTVRGGAIGSSCGGDDTYGCSPDRRDQVVCQAGKWASAGACSAVTQCYEVEQGDTFIGTTCRAAEPAELARAKACSALTGCGYTLSVSACLRGSDPTVVAARVGWEDRVPTDAAAQVALPDTTTCLAQAATCASVSACLTAGKVIATCSGGCDGQVATACLGNDLKKPLSLNCAALSLSCQTDGNSSFCAAQSACGGASSGTSCDGNLIRYCESGRSAQVDCAKQGATCLASGNSATCIGTGMGCQGKGSSCDGSVLVRCTGNQEQRVDCASKGLTCKAWSSQQAECVTAAAASCTTGESCSGTQLVFCEAGKSVGIDCADVGATCGPKGLAFACLMK
jgi:hypothetical protein